MSSKGAGFPEDAARLCARGIEAGIEILYVRELIRRLNLTAYYTPEPDVLDWPWGVKIYTLGRFEIWIDDKKVEFTRKVQKKPMALCRLRRLIGNDKAIICSNGRLSIDSQHCWVDN